MGLFLLLKYCFSSDFKWFSHIQLLVILYRCSTVLNQNISLNPVVFIFFRLFLFINNALAWQFQISLRSSSITVWVLNFMHWKSGLDAASTCKCNKCFLTMFLKLKYISYSCIPPICFPNSILCVMKEVNVFPPPPPTWSWTGLAHARSCIPPSALRYCRLNIFPGFVYKLTGTVNKLYSSAARGLINAAGTARGGGAAVRPAGFWCLKAIICPTCLRCQKPFLFTQHVWDLMCGMCGADTAASLLHTAGVRRGVVQDSHSLTPFKSPDVWGSLCLMLKKIINTISSSTISYLLCALWVDDGSSSCAELTSITEISATGIKIITL